MKQIRWSIAKTRSREAAVQAACARLGVKGLAALLDALLRMLQEQDMQETGKSIINGIAAGIAVTGTIADAIHGEDSPASVTKSH